MASDEITPEAGPLTVDVNSVQHTLKVAILLCLACSVLVSVFAVGLRGWQDENKKAFRQENILKAAGLWETDGDNDIELLYSEVVEEVLDFETNRIVGDAEAAADLDPKKLSNDPEQSIVVENDIASIKRRENRTVIYKITDNGMPSGKLQTLILPIRGYGLWSTLRGYIAFDMTQADGGPDKIQIRGLTYYEHGETPGLGGEVDNVLWKAKWVGKKAFDKDWNVRISVEKGAEGIYEVDALSGATITSRGVSNMLTYWLGDEGFGPYLRHLSGDESTEGEAPADGENANPEHAAPENADKASEAKHGAA